MKCCKEHFSFAKKELDASYEGTISRGLSNPARRQDSSKQEVVYYAF